MTISVFYSGTFPSTTALIADTLIQGAPSPTGPFTIAHIDQLDPNSSGNNDAYYGWYPDDTTSFADGAVVLEVPGIDGRWKVLGSDDIPGGAIGSPGAAVPLVVATSILLPNPAALADGYMAFVQSQKTTYQVMTGAWKRLPLSSPDWRLQTEWAIDVNVGSDDAAGDLADPLASFEELVLRLGEDIKIDVIVHVYLLTDIPNLVISLTLLANGSFTVHGLKTEVSSGTIGGGVVSRASSTNTPLQILASLPQNFSPYRGALLVMTSGPSVNAVSTIAMAQAPTVARMGSMTLAFDPTSSLAGPIEATPLVGNTYKIYTLSKITQNLSVRVIANKPPPDIGSLSFSNKQFFMLDSVNIYMFETDLEDGPIEKIGAMVSDGARAYLMNCRIDSSVQCGGMSPWTRINCSIIAANDDLTGIVDTGVIFTRVWPSGRVFFRGGVLFQLDGTITEGISTREEGVKLDFEDVAFFDWTDSAIVLKFNSTIYALTTGASAAVMWGSTSIADTYPIRIKGASNLILNTPSFTSKFPIAYLAPHLFIMYGQDSLPAFDRTTQTYTAYRLLSKANLDQTVALGGFDGAVMDPVSGAKVSIEVI